MDLYITFFGKAELNGKGLLYIANGFSFFERKEDKDYIDLYVNRDKPASFIEKEISKHQPVDTIYCSLSIAQDLETIRPFITDKWVLGGPLASGLIARGVDLPGKIIAGYYEKHQGNDRLSCQFTPYFRDWAQTEESYFVSFNCSIGKGCYWGKCKFCEYRYFDNQGKADGRISLRSNIGDIVAQLRPLPGVEISNAHLGIPAIPPKALKQILESKRDKQFGLSTFMRADDTILDVLRAYKDNTICQNMFVAIGCESLSQFALDKLNKGTTLENTIEIAKLILERGGYVTYDIMDHYVFANRQMVAETLDALKKLKEFKCEYPKQRISFYNNGVTQWPTKEAVNEFTDDYSHFDHLGYKSYITNIPKNSDAFECNRQISLALQNSGFWNFGEPYKSLEQA